MPDLGILIGFIVVSTGAGVVFAAFAGAYFFGKSRAQNETLKSGADPELLARLARVEQIVESTAIEIERISEGQRFTTKLLSEGKTVES
ncbi:MAG: hypothetical protein M3Z18_09390 [Gemmatimonadota bacterium]|nr:hypothetical protein [Gemmatimonadota bacterium]